MLYLHSLDGRTKIIVLESANLDQLRLGRPAKTPDNSVCIAWTPDPVWLEDRIANTNGDLSKIAKLIDEAANRPEKGVRPPHTHHIHNFESGTGSFVRPVMRNMTEPELKVMFDNIARSVQAKLPAGPGRQGEALFALVVFGEDQIGQYVANCERAACIKGLREMADTLERLADVPR